MSINQQEWYAGIQNATLPEQDDWLAAMQNAGFVDLKPRTLAEIGPTPNLNIANLPAGYLQTINYSPPIATEDKPMEKPIASDKIISVYFDPNFKKHVLRFRAGRAIQECVGADLDKLYRLAGRIAADPVRPSLVRL